MVRTDHNSQLLNLTGAVLADRYQLTSLLGAGGMGFVYQAEQLGLGRSVAIKILRPELVDTRLDWFRAEAMAASRINHPHAVAVYDFGITEEGVAYLVMEHLRGRPLSCLIEEKPLNAERVVGLGAQCLSALDEAHARGVVHCDLTADNIIVERLRDGEDFAKVIDFGLARVFELSGGHGALVGTAEYVAPEQIEGGVVSPKTDLYAVGVLLYEMVVGRTPFAGSSNPVVLKGHLEAAPDAPHHIIPSCPVELSELILHALEKSPDARPADAATMRQMLLDVFPFSESPTTKTVARKSRATPPAHRVPEHRHQTRISALGKHDSALVGRSDEISRVQSFCNGEADDNTMLITGPHGIGKARLAREATQRASPNTEIFAAAADPSGLKLAWYPILGVLEQVLGLAGPPTLEKLTQAVADCGLPDRDVPGLAEAFGVEGPAKELELNVRRREARAATLRALLSIGRRCTSATLVFADADRFDHPSLEVLTSLKESLPHNLRLLITTENEEALGDRLAATTADRLALGGLSPDDARALTQELVGPSHTVPDPAAIHSITDGNPAAIAQLAGWVRLGHGTASVPSLLVDLVSIRVNRLPPDARRVLQAVAIHGIVAPRGLVESTIDSAERSALAETSWTGLLVVGLETLTIPSDLVAQVISACMPADVRRRLHARALTAYGDDGPAGVRAHHAEEATRIDQAHDLYIQAGNDAVRCFDDPGAAEWYRCALRCARAMHEKKFENAMSKVAGASILLAEVLRQTGQFEAATTVCEEAQLYGPDEAQRAMIHRTLGVIAHSAGNPLRGAGYLELAIGDALRSGEREFLCQCYLDLMGPLDALGRIEDATKELKEGINIITMGEGLKITHGPRRLWRLGLKLAQRQLAAGEVSEAQATGQSTLALAQRSGSSHWQGRVSALLATICDAAGDQSAALAHRSNAIDAMRSVGDRRSTAELLIETARSKVANEPESESVLRMAHKLALEVGWVEGVTLSQAR